MNAEIGILKKRAIQRLNIDGKLRYSFTSFSKDYSELTLFLITHCLSQQKLQFLNDVVMTLLKECVANAVKANLKRAFFSINKVEISDSEKYKTLITTFKEEAITNLPKYEPQMQEMKLSVFIYMEAKKDAYYLIIQNNTGMTSEEMFRVNDRLKKASQMTSIEEALMEFSDETEGAGLGLLLNILLLKTTGIGANNFQIKSDGKVTRAIIRIPNIVNTPPNIQKIYSKIANEIDTIPTFPETIQRVLSLCDNPKSDMNKISKEIEKDPSLVTGVLKLANSGGYFTGKSVSSISKATTTIGIKAIRQMTLAHSSRDILDNNFSKFKGFWEHAHKCSFYAKSIADELKLYKLSDIVFLGGLLHDLGKIILLSIDPKTIESINGLSVDRTKNNTAILEEISLGLSHADVGANLAEKWNFSEEIIEMIRNHHSPFMAKQEYEKQVSIIHIADGMIQIEEKRGRYVHFDIEAQEVLGLNYEKLIELHEKIKIKFAESESETSNSDTKDTD